MTGSKIGDLFVQIRTQGLQTSTRGIAGFGAAFGGAAGLVMAGVQAIIGAVKRMAAAVVNSFKRAIHSASEFEYQIAKVATLLDRPAKEAVAQYGQAILDMSVKFGQSTADMNAAWFDIISGTIAEADAMAVLTDASILAEGGVTDVATATRATLTMMLAYKDEVKNAADATDWLTITAKQGRTDMAGLGSRIGLVAGIAAQAGVGLDELGAAISTMTRTLPLEQAITSMRAALQAFLQPQEGAIKVAKKYNVELNTTTLRTDGLVGVMKKLENATDAEKAAIFGSSEAFMGMAAILGDVAGFNRDVEMQANKTGAALKAQAIIADTLSQKWNKFKKRIDAIWIMVGQKFQPALTRFFDWFMAQMPGIVGWIQNGLMPVVVPVFSFILEGLKNMMKVIGFLMRPLKTLMKILTPVVGLMSALLGRNAVAPVMQIARVPEMPKYDQAEAYSYAPSESAQARSMSTSTPQNTKDVTVAQKLDKLIEIMGNSGDDRSLDFGPARS